MACMMTKLNTVKASMVALASHASPLRTLLGDSEGENEGEAI